MKIPVEIYIESGDRDEDDTCSYRLSVKVLPAEDSTTTVTIDQTVDGELSVLCTHRDGLAELARDLKTELLLALFRLGYAEMIEADTAAAAIERSVADISGYLKKVFGATDLAELNYQFGQFVDPNFEVTATSVIRID